MIGSWTIMMVSCLLISSADPRGRFGRLLLDSDGDDIGHEPATHGTADRDAANKYVPDLDIEGTALASRRTPIRASR
jgi:hypothetical protein